MSPVLTRMTSHPTNSAQEKELPARKAELLAERSQLMFVQDNQGCYRFLSWQDATQYRLKLDQLMGQSLDCEFGPVEIDLYRAQMVKVLETLVSERFSCYFRTPVQPILLDLVMSPVPVPGSPIATSVVVSGRVLSQLTDGSPLLSSQSELGDAVFSANCDRYNQLFSKLAWNIHRTLDLPTIWQQTVTGLGKALGSCCCLICPYDDLNPMVQVVAEYRQEGWNSLLGKEFWLAEDASIQAALSTLKPVIVEGSQTGGAAASLSGRDGLATLILPTSYQEQPNGLILVYQPQQACGWSESELNLLQELAKQVGTAIAHASLFSASQALATELQRANSNFLQKHRELEEARQQAEEASRLKSEFLANTSHELRTPLNGMIGFLKLIMDGMADDPVEQAEFIQEAYRSALHLLNIINDVLDIAKIEAGKLQIEMSPVKLDDLLSAVVDFTRSQIQQKNLSFETQRPPTDDEIILYGNYQRLLQVMLNLVGNAIKFTHEGGITIGVEIIKKKVTVHNQELPGMVKVRVADTGIGVSLDKQDKLFQSFSQVDGSRTRQYGGTGLGLAISQKLVEAMGGVVNFYSMGEGLGSTVTFTVPLYQEPVMIMAQSTEAMDLRL